MPIMSCASPILPRGTTFLSRGISPPFEASPPIASTMGADISLGKRPGAKAFALQQPRQSKYSKGRQPQETSLT